jgi:hypothetical protein
MIKEFKIKINAPIAAAFDAVDGMRSQPFMNGLIKTTVLKDAHDVREGLKFHQEILKFVSYDGEIIAFKRPVLFGVGIQNKNFKATFFYRFDELDNNTTELKCEL